LRFPWSDVTEAREKSTEGHVTGMVIVEKEVWSGVPPLLVETCSVKLYSTSSSYAIHCRVSRYYYI
jgi:hypothetical protein